MSNQNSAKGNPAHKRMSNPRHAATRAASWKRGEARKAARRAAQEARHQANVEARQRGSLSPHEAMNADNDTRRKPAPVTVTRWHAPVNTLESVKNRQGEITGWVVRSYTAEDRWQTPLRTDNYHAARVMIDVMSA